jgi:lantibiotic leader peptide-processing serine protease
VRHRGVLAVLLTAALIGGSFAAGPVRAGTAQNYLVLYKAQSVPSDAAGSIQRAGGSLVYSYSQIGVAVARSDSSTFRTNLMRDNRIEGVSGTAAFATRVDDGAETDSSSQEGDLPNAPATDSDNLSGLQWDMRQIHTPEAHAITGGSPAVLVGDIDTGLDKDHPDLQPNIDFANSVSCESGAPNQDPAAWDDHNGHGTHTAGTIAAASNGIGIVGVAPNVKIAGIKSSNDDGFFFPEMVVCAFVWAGTHHIDVTNNSYFVDPFLYNCRNDAEQRAIWKAIQRAVRFAQQQGTTVVSAEGNESDDLAHPQQDNISPDYPPGNEQTRDVNNACVVLPVELPGVIGVTADGHNEQSDDDPGPDYLKSFYSSYGVGVTEVVAPGGDSIFGRNAEAVNGRVLSTYPEEAPCLPSRRMEDPDVPSAAYCYLQGTSMASPHVAGVAALIISMFGDASNPQNGKMRPGQVQALITQTADPQPCPTSLPDGYNDPQPRPSGEPQECQGGLGNNSWYGAGQVNAYNAVTHSH